MIVQQSKVLLMWLEQIQSLRNIVATFHYSHTICTKCPLQQNNWNTTKTTFETNNNEYEEEIVPEKSSQSEVLAWELDNVVRSAHRYLWLIETLTTLVDNILNVEWRFWKCMLLNYWTIRVYIKTVLELHIYTTKVTKN